MIDYRETLLWLHLTKCLIVEYWLHTMGSYKKCNSISGQAQDGNVLLKNAGVSKSVMLCIVKKYHDAIVSKHYQCCRNYQYYQYSSTNQDNFLFSTFIHFNVSSSLICSNPSLFLTCEKSARGKSIDS